MVWICRNKIGLPPAPGWGHWPQTPLFIYGTLLQQRIRDRVLNDFIPLRFTHRVYVPGWEKRFIQDRDYPMLVPHPAARAWGALLWDLTPTHWQRLNEYEGEEYSLSPLIIHHPNGTMGTALTYQAIPGLKPGRRWP